MGQGVHCATLSEETGLKILVTGATGFVGRHVVPELLVRGHEVVGVARNSDRARQMPWYGRLRFVACDVHDAGLDPAATFGVPDAIIHLAWPGLPNYKDLFHFERNLLADYHFLKKVIASGVKQLLVTGTCFEYGMQSGALAEDAPTIPDNAYGLAKDTLRRFLQALQPKHPFTLQWIRLFYLYGPGQNPDSLLAQLDKAIENGDTVFNMSGGEQLRDYLPVGEVARRLAVLVEHPECSGIINCCSGNPISVRRLTEQKVAEQGAKITLNFGYHPYPAHEPFAFWGDARKIASLVAK